LNGRNNKANSNHIENQREDLGSHLHELEHKVKAVTDWRQQFQKNPMTMIGAAVGGGVLLATMIGGRRRSRLAGMSSSEPHARASAPHVGTDHQKQKALETWDNIKGALIGVAATQCKDFLGEIIPGFHAQLSRTEREKTPSSPNLPTSQAPPAAV
jgi:hypothetical protein